jgi:hypothetical protein
MKHRPPVFLSQRNGKKSTLRKASLILIGLVILTQNVAG